MNSILGEISTLRKGAPLVIDYKNSNRYRLVAIEQNGTKTAYYFSSPIYNSRTRKAVDMKFYSKGGVAYEKLFPMRFFVLGELYIQSQRLEVFL